MKGLATLVAAIAASLLLAPAALAATPFTAGTGQDPQVAVSPDGTGHVVWMTEEAGDRVGYCRVPAGGTACDRTELLAFPGGAAAQGASTPAVFTRGADDLQIVAGCWNCGAGTTTDRIFIWASFDRGANFTPGSQLATGLRLGGQSAFRETPQTWLTIGGSSLLAIDVPTTTPIAFTTESVTESRATAFVPGSTQAIAVASDFDDVRFAVYDGGTSAAAMNTQSSWLRDQAVPGATGGARGVSLATGPSGTFLAYRIGRVGDDRARLHRWNPTTETFDAGREIAGSDGLDNSLTQPDLTQDPAGRLHAIWYSQHRDGRLRYRRSTDGGVTFTAAANLALREVFSEPQVAAAADATGFAVWRTLSGAIRVVELDPQPEPAPPADPPPADPPPEDPPAPAPPPEPADLEVTRLELDRGDRRFRVRARLDRDAGGSLRIRLRARGRTERLTAPIDRGRVRLNERVSRRIARARSGSVRLRYAGDADTAAETVRLRAGRRAAALRPRRPVIEDGELTARGRIARRARGRVTVTVRFADGATHRVRARIRRGRYRVRNEALPPFTGAARVITEYKGRAGRGIHGERRIRSARMR